MSSPEFPYQDSTATRRLSLYGGSFGGTFPGLQDLNFNDRLHQRVIRDVCLYWIRTFGIDGIRFDNTVNFYRGDARGTSALLEDIHAHLDANAARRRASEHFSLDAGASILERRCDQAWSTARAATSYWDNALYGACFDALWTGTLLRRAPCSTR